MQRRTLVHTAALVAATASGLIGMPASAQGAWPMGKTISYVVPFAAGGTTDTLARLIGQQLGTALGTTVIVENKGGAAGSIGSEAAARAAPDGYTLLGGTVSSHAINISLYPKLGYDPIKSFDPVTLIGTNPVVLVVAANSPYKTLKDVLAAAKTKQGGAVVGVCRHRQLAASGGRVAGFQVGHQVHPRALQGQRPRHPGRDQRPGGHDV